MTAVLQFEIDRGRLKGFQVYGQESSLMRVVAIARAAMDDTFRNEGTFVLVVGPEKITIVQRTEADGVLVSSRRTKP